MIFERGYFQNKNVSETVINESLRQTRSFSSKNTFSAVTTVFLSHKHTDLEDLKGVMGMLEDFNVRIYIDSMDNKMPNETTGETAARIKQVIEYSDRFILLATEAAIESYWCNWELGIGDVHKFIKNIAILPIKEKNEYDWKYKGNEYLQIYPRIDYRDGTTFYAGTNIRIEKGYYYVKPKGDDGFSYITPLIDWLRN